MTRFEAELAIASIEEHPKNPRHNAVADDEMVASVREHGVLEPVIVAPHPDKPTKYVLIAGHRRKDAGKKAKLKALPAIIRDDLATEGQQIEAMIIENGHRVDLTPIEEAEGYAQLELLGYKPAAIAAAVGRNIKTVRERLKLLKLSATTQKKVHAGQLNLEDAVAIGEFADDPDATKKLEQAATSGNLRYEITSQRQRRERLQVNAVLLAQLVEFGATEIEIPKGKARWQVTEDFHYVRPDQAAWAEHEDCLAFVNESAGSWPSVHVYCNNPTAHLDSSEKEPQASAQERLERDRQEREAKKAAAMAALTARVSVLVELLGTATKLPPQLRDLVRGLLPQMIGHIDLANWDEAYAIALGMPEPDRWDLVNGWDSAAVARRDFLQHQHIEEIATASDGFLARALVGMLAGFAESNLDALWSESDPGEVAEVRSYYALLEAAGHVLTDNDKTVQETLSAAETHNAGEAAS